MLRRACVQFSFGQWLTPSVLSMSPLCSSVPIMSTLPLNTFVSSSFPRTTAHKHSHHSQSSDADDQSASGDDDGAVKAMRKCWSCVHRLKEPNPLTTPGRPIVNNTIAVRKAAPSSPPPGTDADLASAFFCPKCSVIQPVKAAATYFELFSIPEKFQLNHTVLDNAYRRLQARLHPDMYTKSSPVERAYAHEQAALLNVAYAKLKLPHQRAEYMLRLRGVDIGEGNTVKDPLLIMEIMERREAVEMVSSDDQLKQLANENQRDLNETIDKLNHIFNEIDTKFPRKSLTNPNHNEETKWVQQATDLAVRLQYLTKIEMEIRYWDITTKKSNGVN